MCNRQDNLHSAVPNAMDPIICANTSGVGFSKPNVAATPDDTPIIPRTLP